MNTMLKDGRGGQNASKSFLILFLLICTFQAFSQEKKSGTESFIRSFNKNFHIPPQLRDSCFSTGVFLRIYFDKNLKPSTPEFSDNAANIWKDQLTRILPSLDTKSLAVLLKQNGLKNVSILFPVFFVNQIESCLKGNQTEWYGSGYTRFDGKQLEETSVLREPILMKIYSRNH